MLYIHTIPPDDEPHHFHVPNVMKVWEPKTPGTLWVTPGLLRDSFTFTFLPPDDGLQICPKYVEYDLRNKLRINSASSWFLLHRYIEMHGQQNTKLNNIIITKAGQVS